MYVQLFWLLRWVHCWLQNEDKRFKKKTFKEYVVFKSVQEFFLGTTEISSLIFNQQRSDKLTFDDDLLFGLTL